MEMETRSKHCRLLFRGLDLICTALTAVIETKLEQVHVGTTLVMPQVVFAEMLSVTSSSCLLTALRATAISACAKLGS